MCAPETPNIENAAADQTTLETILPLTPEPPNPAIRILYSFFIWAYPFPKYGP